MNQRLQQFLAAENISQSQFADTIEVARASVSHVLAGRNNPGYDFIRSIALHYPELNLEWLISGKGKMYKNTDSLIFPVQEEPQQAPEPVKEKPAAPVQECTTTPEVQKQRQITRIVVFYDDNTFQELK